MGNLDDLFNNLDLGEKPKAHVVITRSEKNNEVALRAKELYKEFLHTKEK